MKFSWEKYVYLAEKLLILKETGLEEACLRSSISRAYYGVFCISRNGAGISDCHSSNVHQKVIEVHKKSGDKNKQEIGLILDELRGLRNKADYDDGISITKGNADRAMDMANEILDFLK